MLKSLELFGFKSFADRTTFDFAEGITCVVGPNGSGKSNVVDAIKWILGDQSAKSLRGKEMADVIFNGSAGRKPSGFAEATLTFDNSQGLLPIDAAEVQIGRRLYSGGDSEYLLNRGVVRLKDIREIFMGTGAGTAAYSIIEQGRVDQILQANPTARRIVFEEAAGISRYKARKVEAQRRLERVDQNLLRLQDLVDQLEGRLNATRSQASKAARYRELSTELRELWTGLAADDYRHAEAELARCHDETAGLQESLATNESQLAALEEQFGEVDAAATRQEQQLRQAERRRSTGREHMARHESTIRHHVAQQAELEAEIDRLRHQRFQLRNQARAIEEDLANSTLRLERLQADLTNQQDTLQERDRRMQEMRERLQDAVEQIDKECAARESLQKDRARLEREQAALESRRESAAAHVHDLEAQCQEIAASLEESRAELAERKAALRTAEELVVEAQRRIDNAREERRLLRGAHTEADSRIAEWRENRSAKLARRQLLEDLDSRQEGLNLGVRSMMQRAARSKSSPWNLILGNVGELLQAELDDAPLLEVALGARVQLLVIKNLKPLVSYINSAIADVAGRVGFLELSDARQAHIDQAEQSGRCLDGWPDLSELPGVVCRADQLVSQASIPGLAVHLLCDTWIVATLDDAIRLSQGAGRGCRFVTQQGELIDAEGSLFVGHTANEVTVISRKSELRRLRVELQELDRRIAAEQQRLDVLDESLLVSDVDLQELQAVLNERMEALAIRKSEHAGQAAECGRILAEIDATRAQQQQLAQSQEHMDEERARQRAELEDIENQLVRLTGEIEERQEIAQAVEEQLQLLQQETTAEQLQLAKHEERLASLQSAHARLLEDQQQRNHQAAKADMQLVASKSKHREITRAVLAARAAVAQFALTDENQAVECRNLQIRLEECRAARKQLQKQQDSVRDERRRLTDALHELEMRTRELRHQKSALVERIREEFQLELTEIVAAGVTAMQAGQQQSTGSDGETDDGPAQNEAPGDSPHAELLDQSGVEEVTDVASSEDQIQVRAGIEARVERLRRKIKALGSINTDSLQDLDDLESRYNELAGQLEDLEQAKAALEDIIRRINVESRRLFLETFETIRVHFQELYRKLFGGGEGNIILEDPDDVLECGIDIVARPPGKELRSISLLSGGEKTMTAVALLFAMFKSKPSPYCILDEVDAALDEANVDRYVNVVKEFRDSTQFVIITHRKRTMTAADRLYGVTMEQAGVSKRLTVQFEDVSENGHIRTGSAAA